VGRGERELRAYIYLCPFISSIYLSVSVGSYGPLHASKTVNLFLSVSLISLFLSINISLSVRANSSRQTDRALAESCRRQNKLPSQFSVLLFSDDDRGDGV